MLQDQVRPFVDNPDLPLPLMDDRALVAGLQRGDSGAVEYVVHLHAPALYRYAYHHLQDAMLAEDLVAEVMTRMIGRIDRYALESTPFEAWLFRIARNLIADHFRLLKRRPQVSYEEWLGADPAAEPGSHDAGIDIVGEREELLAGLAVLTEEQRQVVLLHAVEGWELPQVATLLDRTLPSVKSAYYRGLQTLRKVISRGDAARRHLRA